MTTMLDKIIARDLADDRHRAATFPGGYCPTARVLVQRERADQAEEIKRIGREVAADHPLAGGFWTEHGGEGGIACGFTRNDRRTEYTAACRAFADRVNAAGFVTRWHEGEVIGVRWDQKRIAEVEACADAYIAKVKGKDGTP